MNECTGVMNDDPFPTWATASIAFFAGAAIALLIAIALIPDQPDRILVPVPEQQTHQPREMDA